MFKIISVGWNCAPFLTQTIQSVQAQSVTDWQYAVVYDKSDDNGADILLQLAAVEPRMRGFYSPMNLRSTASWETAESGFMTW